MREYNNILLEHSLTHHDPCFLIARIGGGGGGTMKIITTSCIEHVGGSVASFLLSSQPQSDLNFGDLNGQSSCYLDVFLRTWRHQI